LKTDTVIIGGGLIGLYTAYALLSDNLKLTVIEQGELGQQSSWASGGILSPLLPWHYKQEVHDLISGVDHVYEKLASSLLTSTQIDIQFWRCGMKILGLEELSSAKQWARQHELPLEISDNSYTLPSCSQVRSPRLIQALIEYLKSKNVTLLTNTTFNKLNIVNDNIKSIDTSIGEIYTDTVIFAGGANKQNTSMYDLQQYLPPVKPVLGQIIAFDAPDIELNTIVYSKGYYLIPRKDGLILVGSTLEQVGFDQRLSLDARTQLKQVAFSMLPALSDYPMVHQWSGLRPGSENNIPTIGPHPTVKGLFLNCGHFRYGIAMAPRSAQIIRDWLLDPTNLANNTNYLMRLP
jgi:glycine oxidase